MTDALVIGAGPAGLMAAEELARAGRDVVVMEAKPSVGRKFLMAGKSGLNITKDEAARDFQEAYGEAAGPLRPMLDAFGPPEVQAWARELGQEVFIGSSGRVFPVAMKASPLLRAWMGRLAGLGVTIRTRHRWTGWTGDSVHFETVDGPLCLKPKVTVLALGGGSWARLGSDGTWLGLLKAHGVACSDLRPANAGLTVSWTPHMARHFGSPVKGAALVAGKARGRGEFIVSAKGLEGGGVYAVFRTVREGAPLTLDLAPDRTEADLLARLSTPRAKESLTNYLRKRLGLDPVKLALLREFGGVLPEGPALARLVKALPVRHAGPRPIDEAISTAGGVMWEAVDEGLMVRALPGVFVAGEMLDWEAPTGGYLLTACVATGRWAGRAAARV